VKKIFLLTVFFSVLANVNLYAQSLTSTDLLNNTKRYDGQTVAYQGEVIGDIMVRGEYAWLHINDGITAIGAWIPKTLVSDIQHLGDYHQKGDIVEIRGEFHRACPEHGGDLDIHVQEITKIASGNRLLEPASISKLYLGIFLTLISLLVYAVKFWKRKE
jgi:hypothetical protein